MAQVTITINSREYAVSCEDGQEIRIMQLARVLDEKARLITGGTMQVNENMLLAMVGLLLADEVNELKRGAPAAAEKPAEIDPLQLKQLDSGLSESIKQLTVEIKSVASHLKVL